MKQLKNCVKYSCSVKIYIPSTVNVDKGQDNKEWVEGALVLLSKLFGGATTSKAFGAWVSNGGNLVKENINLVFAYCDQKDLEESIEKIYDFCLKMKQELFQEAVGLEINNELYLV